MVITRKVRVYVNEDDKKLRSEFYNTLRSWSNLTRKAANIVMSHKFAQQNIRDFVCIKDDIKDKFYVKDILVEGKGMSEQNTTYRILSDVCKGKLPSDIYSCLNSILAKSYAKRYKEMVTGRMSLPSFRNDIPMPFSRNPLEAIKIVEVEYEDTKTKKTKKRNDYTFQFFGVPMVLSFGKDKSGNRGIVDRCLSDDDSFSFAQSSLVIDGSKIFVNICINIKKENMPELDHEKVCSASLGFITPIVANYEGSRKIYEIGSKEEFLSIREHIQGALRRIRIASRFSKCGKGRERKLQATERFKKKEYNYIQTQLHVYSSRLVKYCVNNKCGVLRLVSVGLVDDEFVEIPESEKSERIKANPYLLRNWGYHGLLDKIQYKCNRSGIELLYDKKKVVDEDETALDEDIISDTDDLD